MASLLGRPARAARERMSSLVAAPAPGRVDDMLRALSRRWPVRELCAAPPGSGLRPVLGDYGPPLVGHVLHSSRFGTDFARERHDRIGPVSWIGAFGTRIVNVSGPEATQVVFINRDKAFSQEGWAFLIDRFFHRGLMLLDFDEHHTHRLIMQQAFTRDRLAGYVRQFGPTVRSAVPTWRVDGPVRLYWALKGLTLDVATKVFMALDRAPEADRINRAFVATVRAATALVRHPLPGTRWRAGVRGRRLLESYFAGGLAGRQAGHGDDLFTALCHASTPEGERFTGRDVVNHMIFLMMAAHDTSTIASTAAAYYLARYPEWQERAREESLALGEDVPDIAALDRLRTLDLVIRESLRLVAPVPSVMRKTVKATDVLGYYLPAGTLVAAQPSVNHFDPGCWTRPDAFDPERFADHRREDRNHRYAWVPFGGGAHKCIGMHFGVLEVKAILHEMLRCYRWSVAERYRVRWDHTSLPVPVDGLPVRLVPR
ncbi:cytochrome P450 [Gandjariella thermophila]|uniref:Cytochrome P450 n=1 Tax=Gandjariella thermophila TaxID=1931992 RepID=A0A4D4IW19_9PSEU|nr:cytochrome P450 [Gandjariella thermophila]GDY28545.1 cytochrome P450 [Gandjariella thermophila]